MNKYLNSKIYKVFSNEGEECYIGSTVYELKTRFNLHKYHYALYKQNQFHYISIFEIFDKYGIDNCNVELILDFPCASRHDLHIKEGYYIQQIPHTVNKNVSGRNQKDSYKACIEKYKDHYIQYHKDYNKKYFKNYYETHKEYFKNYHKNRKLTIAVC